VGSLPEWPIEPLATPISCNITRIGSVCADDPRSASQVREAEAEKQSDWSWEVDYQHRGRQFGDMVSVQFSWDLPLFPDSRQNPKIAAKHAELNQLEAEREALSREHTQQLEDELADYER
jgi:hypothetical protein